MYTTTVISLAFSWLAWLCPIWRYEFLPWTLSPAFKIIWTEVFFKDDALIQAN